MNTSLTLQLSGSSLHVIASHRRLTSLSARALAGYASANYRARERGEAKASPHTLTSGRSQHKNIHSDRVSKRRKRKHARDMSPAPPAIEALQPRGWGGHSLNPFRSRWKMHLKSP